MWIYSRSLVRTAEPDCAKGSFAAGLPTASHKEIAIVGVIYLSTVLMLAVLLGIASRQHHVAAGNVDVYRFPPILIATLLAIPEYPSPPALLPVAQVPAGEF